MTIHIEDLSFDVIIGLLDFERDKAQKVIVNLEASYDYVDAVFINYADIATLMQAELKEKRYKLLENALLGLKDIIYSHYPQINTLSLKLSKPDILENCCVSLSKTWNF
ncbi:MAG: dihydroneopterin aldolase [Epsilonproteobacteria bacterium]|nr:MAG: dihydroneopterin aldolase [Campylobacterota bacterium]